jgi:hypothetical protein
MVINQLTKAIKTATIIAGLLFIFVLPSAFAAEDSVDQIWTQTLERYVDDKGFVDYDSLKKNRAEFDQYIVKIQTTGPDSTPEHYGSVYSQLAYYINAYNAMVFKGVIDRGPEKESVWKGWVSGLNFFVRMDIVVDGKKTNLKKLEDKVVRAQFKDPRIHAALNCASISCPRLINEPYMAEKLDQQLDDAMREFLNSNMHVRVNTEKQSVSLSKIFDWYESDFIDFETEQGVTAGSKKSHLLGFVNRYRDSKSQIPTDYKVRNLDYDKGINAQ